jgi:hypothetical protein
LTYVEFELSYDRHNENANNIYRTVSTFYINGELRGTYPLSDFGQDPALLENIPEFKNFVRTHLMHGGAVVSNNDNLSKRIQFYEDESIQFVDGQKKLASVKCWGLQYKVFFFYLQMGLLS